MRRLGAGVGTFNVLNQRVVNEERKERRQKRKKSKCERANGMQQLSCSPFSWYQRKTSPLPEKPTRNTIDVDMGGQDVNEEISVHTTNKESNLNQHNGTSKTEKPYSC